MQNNNNITSPTQSLNFQLETLLNNPSQWQTSPVDTTRQCFKMIYNLLKINTNSISQLDRQKCNKTELNSALNIKANVADIMRTFNEVATSIDARPTIEDVQLLLSEKVSREEITNMLASRLSIEDLSKLMESGEMKINLKCSFEELSKNFVSLKEFNEIINTKANKDNVITALHKKANKIDIDKQLKAMSDEIIEKINNAKENEENFNKINSRINDIDQDVDRLIENIKKQFQTVNGVLNNLTTNKADYKEIETILSKGNMGMKNAEEIINKVKNDFSDSVNKIKNDFTKEIKLLEEKMKNNMLLEEKSNNDRINKISNDLITNYHALNDDIVKLNKHIVTSTATKNDFNLLTQKIDSISSLISQPMSEDIHNEMNSMMKQLSKLVDEKIEDCHQYTQDYIKHFDNDINLLLDKKANINEVTSLLAAKADIDVINTSLDRKANQTELASLKLSIEKMSKDFIDKIDYEKFDSFVSKISNQISEIQKDLMMKANIKETMTYLKNKADIDEVNKALNVIHDDLDNKSSIEEFNVAMDNQNAINTALCRVNCIGTWRWNSGDVRNGFAVPWEEQVMNTSPEVFLWDKDKTNITVNEKGIYEIALAFFVKDKPVIQVLVNGENAFSVVNSNNFVVRHTGDENDGGIEENVPCGLSVKEFLNLEEKARITISYSGDDKVKGIMFLKKI